MNTAANSFYFTNSNSAAAAAYVTAAVAIASADASTSVTTSVTTSFAVTTLAIFIHTVWRNKICFSFLSRFNISFPMTLLRH